MGILRYLKNIILPAPEEENAGKMGRKGKGIEGLMLDEIRARISSKQKEISEKNEELKKKAKMLINENIALLKEGLNALRVVNLEKRKEEKRLKEIVLENSRVYADYLEKFIDDLEKFEDFNQISKIFASFSKNSFKSYQKATILIGREFEAIQNALKKFVASFNLLLEENQKNDEKTQKLKEIEARFNEIDKILIAENEIKDNILKLKDSIKKKEEEITKNEGKRQEIIRSSGYIQELEKKNAIKEEIKNLENEISGIIAKINLKELARIYHSDEKKHKIIQGYIKDYRRAIEGDEERNFEKIARESLGFEINLAETNNKIKELSTTALPNEIKAKEIEADIENIKKQARVLDENINEEEKKIERFQNKMKDIENRLRLDAGDV